tara:strand:+ start:1048 stop:1377 length:330 start_codon:yes stop_codon:yes gene_type:complete
VWVYSRGGTKKHILKKYSKKFGIVLYKIYLSFMITEQDLIKSGYTKTKDAYSSEYFIGYFNIPDTNLKLKADKESNITIYLELKNLCNITLHSLTSVDELDKTISWLLR